jgi:hypothetical protein
MKGVELKSGDLEGLFKGLLDKKAVDCLVLPHRVGNNVAHMMVTDKDKIESPVPAIFREGMDNKGEDRNCGKAL